MQQDPIRQGNEWVWPDGTTLPVVSGGQIDVDAMGGDDASAPEAPTADAPADAPSADAPAADAPAVDDAPASEVEAEDKFAHWPEDARAERQKLIDENAKYRQRWKPFEETFGGLHEDDQQFLLGFVDAFKAGDAEEVGRYAPALRAYLDKLTPAQRAKAEDAIDAAAGGDATGAAAAADEGFDPFDPKAVEALVEKRLQATLEERDRKAAEQQAAKDREAEVKRIGDEIQSEAKKLGEEHGIPEWGDPSSGLYAALVSVAQRIEGETTLEARLAKAAGSLMEQMDSRGQALLKAKTAGAGEAVAPHGGDEPSGRKVPRTLDEANEAAMKRLEGLTRGPTGS